MLEFTQLIAAKYNAEYGTATSRFSLADNTIATVTITIPTGMIAYIIETKGYCNTADVVAELKDRNSQIVYDWEEFPDTMFTAEQIPFLKAHEINFKYVFTNTSGGTSEILIIANVMLVPKINKEKFEEDVKKLPDALLALLDIKQKLATASVSIRR